jgi:hypothetical protein
MFPYDPTLLAAVQTSPQSVPDVIQIMQTIAATCIDGDGLKWFNWLYLQVTQAVEARVLSGEFADSAWLAGLDVQFARLYFGAVKSALSGQQAAGCWEALFQRRNQTPIARIQFCSSRHQCPHQSRFAAGHRRQLPGHFSHPAARQHAV